MRTKQSTLLGLSIGLVVIGSLMVYGVYTGALNESNANLVIAALLGALGVIVLTVVIQRLRRARKD